MSLVSKIRPALLCGALVATALLASAHAKAFPKFAAKEGVACNYCHLKAVGGGGPRGFRGMYYEAHDNSFTDFDNVYEAKAAGVSPDATGPDAKAVNEDFLTAKPPAVLNFVVKDIDGKTVNLGRYQGNVILLVNVASKCGNTPQYAALEKLYDKYKSKGFTILAFPANDFAQQEPGTNKEIKEFCTATYKVAFPLFSKTVVKGDDQTPLYKYLTSKDTDPKFGGPIDWNFAKFLVGRNGELVARYPAKTSPATPAVVADIEKQLAVPQP